MSKKRNRSVIIEGLETLAPGEHLPGWAQTAASLSEPIDVSITEVIEDANKAKEAKENGQMGDIR